MWTPHLWLVWDQSKFTRLRFLRLNVISHAFAVVLRASACVNPGNRLWTYIKSQNRCLLSLLQSGWGLFLHIWQSVVCKMHANTVMTTPNLISVQLLPGYVCLWANKWHQSSRLWLNLRCEGVNTCQAGLPVVRFCASPKQRMSSGMFIILCVEIFPSLMCLWSAVACRCSDLITSHSCTASDFSIHLRERE